MKKIILWTTAVLTVVGTAGYVWFVRDRAMYSLWDARQKVNSIENFVMRDRNLTMAYSGYMPAKFAVDNLRRNPGFWIDQKEITALASHLEAMKKEIDLGLQKIDDEKILQNRF